MLQIGRAPADWFDPELRRYSSMNAVIALLLRLVKISRRFAHSLISTLQSTVLALQSSHLWQPARRILQHKYCCQPWPGSLLPPSDELSIERP